MEIGHCAYIATSYPSLSLVMHVEVQRVISENHPSLTGHFPGKPIVPGVLILEEVVQALMEWNNSGRLQEVSSVKFIAPLQPGRVFSIRLTITDNRQVHFSCIQQGQLFAKGRLEVDFQDCVR